MKLLHNEARSRTGSVSTKCIHILYGIPFSSKSHSIFLSTFLFSQIGVVLNKVSVSTCVCSIKHPTYFESTTTAFYCSCLLICTAIAAPFHTSAMVKNTNFTLIVFTGQQEPDQTTLPSLCSLSCLFVTICSRQPCTRTVSLQQQPPHC